MRNIYFFLVALLILILNTSCGNFKEKFGRKDFKNVNITITRSSDPSTMTWSNQAQQFMVYIVGTSATNYSVATPIILPANATSASAQIAMPGGTYHGYALAWDSNDLSGNVGCWQDSADHFLANGTQHNINITIGGSATSCDYNSASGVFGPSAYATTTNFFPLTIRACKNATPSAAGACTPGIATTTYVTGSVRVVLDSYVKTNGQYQPTNSPGLIGACITLTGGVSSTSPWIIPVGSNNASHDKFISTTLHFYADSTCTSSTHRIIGFPNGLYNGSVDGGSVMTNSNVIAIDIGS